MKHLSHTLCMVLLASCIVLPSCREQGEDLMNPNTVRYNTPSEQFQAIWLGINHSYAFWDIDPTNWDSLYHAYSSRFEALDKRLEAGNAISTDTLRAYYTDMCSHFIDHHMAICIINPWRNQELTNDNGKIIIRPGEIEAKQRSYYHAEFSDSLLLACIKNAGGTGCYSGGTISGEPCSALACNFDGIAYLKLSGYMLSEVFNASDSVSEGIQNVYLQFHQWCAAKDLKGIILDNRGNGGGDMDDMNYVVAPFLSSELQLGHIRHKEGLGRYDYTPWLPFIVRNGDWLYQQAKRNDPTVEIDSIGAVTVPIVALADINSVSMGEMTTRAIQELPNGYFIGERTFGGHGPLFGNFEIDYSGTFGNQDGTQPPYYYVYTSNAVLRDTDGKITEGIGYTPDLEVPYDAEQMRAGTDVQLNAALNYIRSAK